MGRRSPHIQISLCHTKGSELQGHVTNCWPNISCVAQWCFTPRVSETKLMIFTQTWSSTGTPSHRIPHARNLGVVSDTSLSDPLVGPMDCISYKYLKFVCFPSSPWHHHLSPGLLVFLLCPSL